MNDVEIRGWMSRTLAIVNPPVDYVTVNSLGSGQSQTLRIDVADHSADDVIGRAVSHIGDLEASHLAEGKRGPLRVKVLVYRVKEGRKYYADGRTFVSEEIPNDPEETDGTVKGETVAVVRELRQLVTDQSRALAVVSNKGWEMSATLLDQNVSLRAELIEKERKLMQLETSKQPGIMDDPQMRMMIAGVMAQVLPDLLKRFTTPPAEPS